MAVADDTREETRDFLIWLQEATQDFDLRVAVKYENDQWFALLTQFDITGAGDTTADAVRDALDLLFAYLRAFHAEGAPFSDALRPIPARLSARIAVESQFQRLARQLLKQHFRGSESSYELPPGMLASLAHC